MTRASLQSMVATRAWTPSEVVAVVDEEVEGGSVVVVVVVVAVAGNFCPSYFYFVLTILY